MILQGPRDGAAARAAAAGLMVLQARADGRRTPFATAHELLAPAVEQLRGQERRAAFAGAARLAAGLFEDEQEGTSEFALVHALYWLTARLADRTPLALLVEDAAEADEPSLRLCAYLAHRIDELPVALVLA